MQRAERLGWIEWARVLGALGVVMLHVFTSTALTADLSIGRLVAYDILSIVLGRWAVPAFFMITGFLLLDPARDLGWQRALRYVRRMVMVLFTYGLGFSLMEEAWMALREGSGLGFAIVPAAVFDVLRAASWDHLWYVYALVAVYVLSPVVYWLREHLREQGFLFFSVVLFVLALVVPTVLRLVATVQGEAVEIPQQGLWAFVWNAAIGLTCFCVGGCLRTLKWGVPVVVAGVGSVAFMLVASVYSLVGGNGDLGFIFLQGSCFACVYALFVLMALRRAMGTKPIRTGSAVDQLARDSFGIYVLHPLIVHAVLVVVDPLVVPAGVYEVAFMLVAVVGSVGLTRALRYVPLLGDLL